MLTADQENYLLKIPKDKLITILPFDDNIPKIVESLRKRIIDAGINLDVKFMGASALGISGQGDIDLYILCPEKDYLKYLPNLEKILGSRIPNISIIKWLLKIDNHEIEIYLTDPNTTSMQDQIKIYESLRNNPILLKQYEIMKTSLDGRSFREYMKQKYEFFNRILYT